MICSLRFAQICLSKQVELGNEETYCLHFHFLISRFREKELRVCGAEVERTLQKCGGGFEFAMRIIAYHSLLHPFFH